MGNRQLNLPPAPLQRVTEPFAPEAKPSVTARHSVKWAEIPEIAFDRARLQRKAIADDLGKSNSWFCRALKGLEKLGWLDLGGIADREFWIEMVDLICEFHDIPARGATAQDLEYMRIGKAHVELQAMVARAQR